LQSVLEGLGFQPVTADSSFWVRNGDPCIVFLSSVVDDMLVTSEDEAFTISIVNQILAKLPGKHMGVAKHFNGFKLTWLPSHHAVVLSQPGHIKGIVDKYALVADLSVPRQLPMKGGLKLCKSGTSEEMDSKSLNVEKYHYRALIGALNFLACCSRPDIVFSVNQLARYSNDPKVAHWDVAIGVVRYLKFTQYWGVALGHGTSIDKVFVKHKLLPEVCAYADANHGTGIDDKKSITGLVLQVFGGPVNWASKVQPVTSTSSTESEYRALSEASKEALWLAKIVKLFGIKELPFTVKGDNMGSLTSIRNHSNTRHTKHIEIHHDFMKDRFRLGHLDYAFIEGRNNPADIFTKALERIKFEQFRNALGMVNVEDFERQS
jgi:hypothetical protein